MRERAGCTKPMGATSAFSGYTERHLAEKFKVCHLSITLEEIALTSKTSSCLGVVGINCGYGGIVTA